MFKRLRIAVILLLAIGSASSVVGQTTSTTGALFGAVADSESKALPGVTVTITSPSLQGPRIATTNAAGEYTFPLLPPGTYRVQAALSGFDAQVRDSVVVSLNKTTKINVSMSLARVSESVTVSGNTVVVDPTQ